MENWITTRIELDTNKSEISRFLFRTFTADSNGNILEESEYDPDSNLVNRKIYRHFDTGEVMEYIEYDPLEELIERHYYTKNENGEIDQIEFEYGDGHKSIKEFSFTDLGNADKAIIRDTHGEITGYEIFTFDDQENVKEEIELDADQNEVSKFERTYYESGKIKLQKQFRDRVLFSEETFEYDQHQNLIKKIHKNKGDNFVVVDEFKYDQNNNLTYTCSHQNGELIFENKCGYDSKNRLILEEFFELDYWQKKIIRHERLIHEMSKS